jgi:hypothetical protein
MAKRTNFKQLDKVMVGNIDSGIPDYADLVDFANYIGTLIGAGSAAPDWKDGYRWIKGDGNSSTTAYEIGDEIIGVGTLYPGYIIHGYIKAAPSGTDPNAYVAILSSVKQ